ncbi:MAG: hypothetical protein RL095_4036 [Verrucomicrobiota bacterium]|jgi:FtsH-binding integral membrane protein
MGSVYYDDLSVTAVKAEPEERAAFIRRTYLHLTAAIGLFALGEVIAFKIGFAAQWFIFVCGLGKAGWLLMVAMIVGAGWVAEKMAKSGNRKIEYAGLGIYIIGEIIIFIPILLIATSFCPPSVLYQAIVITLALVGGLSTVVFATRQDFSFLGSILAVTGMLAFGTVICGIFFGFNLGLVFASLMLVFASGCILYTTSKILHYYPVDGHVGASLELFAAVMLMFWYVLRILMILSRFGSGGDDD